MERRGIQLLCNGSIAGVDAALGARVATALESGDGGNGDGVVHARNMEPVLRDALGRAAGHYLYHEKLRGKMICPVGNFHIRNGATAWRLNVQGGDYTKRGGQSSYGGLRVLVSLLLLFFLLFFFIPGALSKNDLLYMSTLTSSYENFVLFCSWEYLPSSFVVSDLLLDSQNKIKYQQAS